MYLQCNKKKEKPASPKTYQTWSRENGDDPMDSELQLLV